MRIERVNYSTKYIQNAYKILPVIKIDEKLKKRDNRYKILGYLIDIIV